MQQRDTTKPTWFDQNLVCFTRFGSTAFFINWRYKLEQVWKDHPRFGGGIVISVILFLMVCASYFLCLTPAKPWSTEHRVVEIRFGTPLREVGQMLESHGLIRNRFAFEMYIRFNPQQRMIKAGRYQIGPGMNVPGIVSVLRTGRPEQIRITIPEGLTVQEVATLFASKGLVDRERFLDVLTHDNLAQDILTGFNVNLPPEGFLFPDTYEFRVDASETEIITIMLKRFREVFESNFKGIPPAKVKNLVIMASLVEMEAKNADERAMIAGVFYNRLKENYPLQSCATVQYALGARKAELSIQDTKINSPYNTYLHNGFPPGPIANPGLASLRAAVNPAKVTYFYFVAKPDGSHAFSNTFEQHIQAERKIENESKIKHILRL